jgi:hypothetical protein
MPDILQQIRDTYTQNPAAALNLLSELFKQYDEGLIKAMPCKVGDTVYKISYDCARGIRYNPYNENGCSTAEICLKCDAYPCDLHKNVIPVVAKSEDWIWENKSAFGKTVFLTRPEAEKALEGENK